MYEMKKETQWRFDYHKIPELTDYIVEALVDFELINDPELACDKLISTYTSGINKYSFQHKPNRKNSPIKPWVSPSILASIDTRCTLFKLKQINPSDENKNMYTKYRNILNGVIRKAKQNYIQSQLEASKHDAKKMWETLMTYTIGKTPQNKYPNSFQVDDEKCIETPSEIAENFNAFFSSVGKKLQENIEHVSEHEADLPADTYENTTREIEHTTREELISIITNMKNVGSGLDKINSKIFKQTYAAILDKLVYLINICLTYGKFPSRLKIAVVKPIYKSNDRRLMTNYRPISMLPYISKILEKIIHSRLLQHIETNDILCPNQFGFRKGLSTYMPLIILQDKIMKGFESNKISFGVFLDLKKGI